MALISAKKGIIDVVLYLIVFIVVQIIVTYVGIFGWGLYQGEALKSLLTHFSMDNSFGLIAVTSVFSSLITIAIFLSRKWTPVTRDYLQ